MVARFQFSHFQKYPSVPERFFLSWAVVRGENGLRRIPFSRHGPSSQRKILKKPLVPGYCSDQPKKSDTQIIFLTVTKCFPVAQTFQNCFKRRLHAGTIYSSSHVKQTCPPVDVRLEQERMKVPSSSLG